MITEDYVSFEIAKLLQEKGIEDDCEYTGWIGKSGNHYFPDDTYLDDDEMIAAQKDRKEYIPLISLQMAMKWLREVHHLFIGVEPRLSFTDYYWITANVYRVRKKNSLYHAEPVDDYSCVACCDGDSFEDACESAIKYCLEKLI